MAAARHTLWILRNRLSVTWDRITVSVADYISSCHKCAFAKAPHVKADVGDLHPTLAPSPFHTMYVDAKGPLPGGGHILSAVDAFTRYTRLRYLPNLTASQVAEELAEIFACNGSLPVVIRCDNGLITDTLKQFCVDRNIQLVPGLAYHSQGQGLVESRFRTIAAAIMATLGGRASSSWADGTLLMEVELALNSTIVDPIGGSPFWCLHGREPRTAAVAAVSATHTLPLSLSKEETDELVAELHAHLDVVQGRALLSSSVAQIITKRRYDATHPTPSYTVGQWVLRLVFDVPDRLSTHFDGPYKITDVSPDGIRLTAVHYLTENATPIVFHVSRARPFDFSRATPQEILAHGLDKGSFIIDKVLEHRITDGGLYQFHIQWVNNVITSWAPSGDVYRVQKVIDYCSQHGLPRPAVAPSRTRSAPPRAAAGARPPRGRA